MTDSSLLPYNATKFEKDVEAAIRYDINTDYLSGFKFDPVGDNVSLALSWEYSLGQINVENFKDRVVQGLKFYRLRGTPYALRLALSWYGFDDIGIEEEELGEHFAEFQVDLKEVPNNLEVDKIVEAARSAAPLRSRLSRMYNELYDIRRFILDHSDWGDFLSDNSGYQPYEEAPKFSFGRVNTFQLAIEKPTLQYARSSVRYIFAENNDTYKLDWTILDESDIGVLNHEIRRSVWRFMSNKNCVFDGNDHVFELNHSLRSVFENESDMQLVESDPYVFEPDAMGNMTINLSYTPISEVKTVDITAEKKVNLTHGSYSGAFDPIPSTSVLEIMQVKQGSTIFTKGTDYKLTAGQVDWSPTGAEPVPGSSYELTYRYRTHIEPSKATDKSITISGAVSGTMVLVSYTWSMPRYDVITIDSEGIVRRIKGLAHPWTPVVPKAPNGQLVLAEIYQTWALNQKPKVTNNAIRVVQMADIESMKNMIADLYYLISQEQLKNNANATDPTAKKGIFVDPFFDDDMRDQGTEQTGAIVDGKLTLPISTTVHDFAKDKDIYLLPYTVEAVISQEMQTSSMKINPYNAFDPIPAGTVPVSIDGDMGSKGSTTYTGSTTITASGGGASEGDLFHVTEDAITTYAGLNKRDDDGFFWIKYALPEAEFVDMIDLAARRGSEANRMPTWFKIEGSNDDETWDLLLERAFLTQWYEGESRQYWINNETPYKFYRLVSIEQPASVFSISRFRLFRKLRVNRQEN